MKAGQSPSLTHGLREEETSIDQNVSYRKKPHVQTSHVGKVAKSLQGCYPPMNQIIAHPERISQGKKMQNSSHAVTVGGYQKRSLRDTIHRSSKEMNKWKDKAHNNASMVSKTPIGQCKDVNNLVKHEKAGKVGSNGNYVCSHSTTSAVNPPTSKTKTIKTSSHEPKASFLTRGRESVLLSRSSGYLLFPTNNRSANNVRKDKFRSQIPRGQSICSEPEVRPVPFSREARRVSHPSTLSRTLSRREEEFKKLQNEKRERRRQKVLEAQMQKHRSLQSTESVIAALQTRLTSKRSSRQSVQVQSSSSELRQTARFGEENRMLKDQHFSTTFDSSVESKTKSDTLTDGNEPSEKLSDLQSSVSVTPDVVLNEFHEVRKTSSQSYSFSSCFSFFPEIHSFAPNEGLTVMYNPQLPHIENFFLIHTTEASLTEIYTQLSRIPQSITIGLWDAKNRRNAIILSRMSLLNDIELSLTTNSIFHETSASGSSAALTITDVVHSETYLSALSSLSESSYSFLETNGARKSPVQKVNEYNFMNKSIQLMENQLIDDALFIYNDLIEDEASEGAVLVAETFLSNLINYTKLGNEVIDSLWEWTIELVLINESSSAILKSDQEIGMLLMIMNEEVDLMLAQAIHEHIFRSVKEINHGMGFLEELVNDQMRHCIQKECSEILKVRADFLAYKNAVNFLEKHPFIAIEMQDEEMDLSIMNILTGIVSELLRTPLAEVDTPIQLPTRCDDTIDLFSQLDDPSILKTSHDTIQQVIVQILTHIARQLIEEKSMDMDETPSKTRDDFDELSKEITESPKCTVGNENIGNYFAEHEESNATVCMKTKSDFEQMFEDQINAVMREKLMQLAFKTIPIPQCYKESWNEEIHQNALMISENFKENLLDHFLTQIIAHTFNEQAINKKTENDPMVFTADMMSNDLDAKKEMRLIAETVTEEILEELLLTIVQVVRFQIEENLDQQILSKEVLSNYCKSISQEMYDNIINDRITNSLTVEETSFLNDSIVGKEFNSIQSQSVEKQKVVSNMAILNNMSGNIIESIVLYSLFQIAHESLANVVSELKSPSDGLCQREMPESASFRKSTRDALPNGNLTSLMKENIQNMKVNYLLVVKAPLASHFIKERYERKAIFVKYFVTISQLVLEDVLNSFLRETFCSKTTDSIHSSTSMNEAELRIKKRRSILKSGPQNFVRQWSVVSDGENFFPNTLESVEDDVIWRANLRDSPIKRISTTKEVPEIDGCERFEVLENLLDELITSITKEHASSALHFYRKRTWEVKIPPNSNVLLERLKRKELFKKEFISLSENINLQFIDRFLTDGLTEIVQDAIDRHRSERSTSFTENVLKCNEAVSKDEKAVSKSSMELPMLICWKQLLDNIASELIDEKQKVIVESTFTEFIEKMKKEEMIFQEFAIEMTNTILRIFIEDSIAVICHSLFIPKIMVSTYHTVTTPAEITQKFPSPRIDDVLHQSVLCDSEFTRLIILGVRNCLRIAVADLVDYSLHRFTIDFDTVIEVRDSLLRYYTLRFAKEVVTSVLVSYLLCAQAAKCSKSTSTSSQSLSTTWSHATAEPYRQYRLSVERKYKGKTIYSPALSISEPLHPDTYRPELETKRLLSNKVNIINVPMEFKDFDMVVICNSMINERILIVVAEEIDLYGNLLNKYEMVLSELLISAMLISTLEVLMLHPHYFEFSNDIYDFFLINHVKRLSQKIKTDDNKVSLSKLRRRGTFLNTERYQPFAIACREQTSDIISEGHFTRTTELVSWCVLVIQEKILGDIMILAITMLTKAEEDKNNSEDKQERFDLLIETCLDKLRHQIMFDWVDKAISKWLTIKKPATHILQTDKRMLVYRDRNLTTSETKDEICKEIKYLVRQNTTKDSPKYEDSAKTWIGELIRNAKTVTEDDLRSGPSRNSSNVKVIRNCQIRSPIFSTSKKHIDRNEFDSDKAHDRPNFCDEK